MPRGRIVAAAMVALAGWGGLLLVPSSVRSAVDEPMVGELEGNAGFVEPAGPPIPETVLRARRRAEARAAVGRLSEDRYRDREAATKDLWELGEDAVEALEEGLAGADPEVAHRSRLILRRIRTGITPSTPQRVIELVQRYFERRSAGKQRVFEELLEERAFAQMLHLYRYEADPAVRDRCEEILNKAVLPAVLERMVAGQVDEAERLLRLAPVTDENCRRLAALLRSRGRLSAELEKNLEAGLPELDGAPPATGRAREVASMRLALFCASGDVAGAREVADWLGPVSYTHLTLPTKIV
mgnify:CR=1 FL=1